MGNTGTRYLVALGAAALIASSAAADGAEQLTACAIKAADALERSGEPAESIATAAMQDPACRFRKTAITYEPGGSAAIAARAERDARDAAVTHIVGIRAKRGSRQKM